MKDIQVSQLRCCQSPKVLAFPLIIKYPEAIINWQEIRSLTRQSRKLTHHTPYTLALLSVMRQLPAHPHLFAERCK